MKKSLLIALFCGFLLCSAQSVWAQTGRIGVGAIINDPTGISAKAWFNENLAVDAALSFNIAPNVSQFYIHNNFLYHQDTEVENLRYYFGMGLRFIWTDVSNDLFTALRWPGGISYMIEDSRFEGFFEFAPTLDFAPDARFGFAGGLGMRIYLN